MRRHRQLFTAAAVLGLSATPALAQTSSTTSTSTTSTFPAAPALPSDSIPANPPATTHADGIIPLSPAATTHPDQVVSAPLPDGTSTAPRTAQPAVPSAPRQVALTG